MSKKIIAGALGTMLTVSAFAVLVVPTFAGTDSFHQVTVKPEMDLILGGNVNSNTNLMPSMTKNDSKQASAMTVKSSEPWTLKWQAVVGAASIYADSVRDGVCSDSVSMSKAACELADETWIFDAPTAAAGTNLGTSGFTNSGGIPYTSSALGAAGGANAWTASFALVNATAGAQILTTSLSTVATGSATQAGSITPTYAASVTGSLGSTDTFFGTIYYELSANN